MDAFFNIIQQEAFSEGIIVAMQRHDIEDKPISPDDLASRFCSSNRSANEFRDPGSVLRGARHMVRAPLSLVIMLVTQACLALDSFSRLLSCSHGILSPA